MRWKSLLIFLVALAIINASNLRDAMSVSSLHISPDFLLVFLVFFAVNCERHDAIVVSFAIGFAADISSSAMLIGPYAISYGLLGGVISLFRKQVVMRRFIYQSMSLFFTGSIGGFVAEFLISVKSGSMYPDMYPCVLLTSLYTALIGPLVWLLAKRALSLFFVARPNYSN